MVFELFLIFFHLDELIEYFPFKKFDSIISYFPDFLNSYNPSLNALRISFVLSSLSVFFEKITRYNDILNGVLLYVT